MLPPRWTRTLAASVLATWLVVLLPALAADPPRPAAGDLPVGVVLGETAVAPAKAASVPTAPAAIASAPAAQQASLDTRVQDLKAELIRLNRDLLVLEEELLFPAGTQVAVFVSMDVGKLFELESVQIKLDDKVVSQHLYTPLEVQALHRGGVQRIYLGNLRAGTHEVATLICRCMDSQARHLAGTEYYLLTASNPPAAINDPTRQLDEVLRYPRPLASGTNTAH